MNFLWKSRVHILSFLITVVAALSAANAVYPFLPQALLGAIGAGLTALVGHSLQAQHADNAKQIEVVADETGVVDVAAKAEEKETTT